MSWSGRSLRARIKAIREAGAAWNAPAEPPRVRDSSLRDLVRGFQRDRRSDPEAENAAGPPVPPETVPLGHPPERAPTEPSKERAAGPRFAGLGRRRRDRRAGRDDDEGSERPVWSVAAAAESGAAAGEIRLGRELSRDGSLWVLEERIDPRVAPPDHFAPDFALEVYRERLTSAGVALPARERLIYFDLETTGLASHDLLFMSGSLYWSGDHLILRQEVAEDVAEERELVARARERLHERGVVVTYNGRSFDLPALDRRLRFHGLPPLDRGSLENFDLLHLARRLFRKELPDCKLSTLEREVIRKRREGRDVPGLEVPLRFLDFCESGDLRHLEPVLYHNRIDLTTMVALFPRLLGPAVPRPGGTEGTVRTLAERRGDDLPDGV